MGNFRLFQQVRCGVIVKYTKCNLLEHEWIRAEIRTLEAQIEDKNKNIEARQNVTGSYKKECNSFIFQSFLSKRQFYIFQNCLFSVKYSTMGLL